jgi:hypothetical protein
MQVQGLDVGVDVKAHIGHCTSVSRSRSENWHELDVKTAVQTRIGMCRTAGTYLALLRPVSQDLATMLAPRSLSMAVSSAAQLRPSSAGGPVETVFCRRSTRCETLMPSWTAYWATAECPVVDWQQKRGMSDANTPDEDATV